MKNKEILRLTKLNQLFIKEVRGVEGLDASSFKTYRLKARLKSSHPALCFVRPSRKVESDIVFVENLSVEEVVEDAVGEMTSEESECNEAVSDDPSHAVPSRAYHLRDMFHAAQVVKDSIVNAPNPIEWPPTADDSTLDTVDKIVPSALFNFLAWSTGASSDPRDSGKVEVPDELHPRLLSVAHDIMFLRAKGRILLPKHSSLSMAVRHLTGSAKLIGLLNGFGHCSSNSFALEHDTALAKRQIERGIGALPAGSNITFTTLVWDNNDFGEETTSGKGTTHNTNGILIQYDPSATSEPTSEASHVEHSSRDRRRSVQPPSPNIKKYFGSKRIGPRAYGECVDLQDKPYQPFQILSRKLDLALRVMKLGDSSEMIFPGWTGCNSILQSHIPEVCNIRYLPIIDASPTEYDTVYSLYNS
eukprot:XP_011680975.1 PREDICTED: uncharacterized protein LOC105446186 [Strongylocentrotus purpuratus]